MYHCSLLPRSFLKVFASDERRHTAGKRSGTGTISVLDKIIAMWRISENEWTTSAELDVCVFV